MKSDNNHLVKRCLQDLSYDNLAFIQEWGYPKYRNEQLYNAIIQYKDYDEISNLPQELIKKLEENYYAKGLKVLKKFCGKDGSQKYLYQLNDNNIIEGIFMPHRYGNTLCVSTQVGCRMGCGFCASGLNGLVRDLSMGEILSQVLCVNALNGGNKQERAITNVVLMGSGEPLDNFDNVVAFLKEINHKKNLNISYRNISLSTCGISPKIIELADINIPIVLSVSLHASTDQKRNKLMPINKVHNIDSILQAVKYYFDKTKRRIIFEYALIEGENSETQNAEELSNLVKGLPCHINVINLNYVKEKNKRGVSPEKVKQFLAVLDANNISNSLRRSMGADIEGACGQLRNKYVGDKNAKNTPQ